MGERGRGAAGGCSESRDHLRRVPERGRLQRSGRAGVARERVRVLARGRRPTTVIDIFRILRWWFERLVLRPVCRGQRGATESVFFWRASTVALCVGTLRRPNRVLKKGVPETEMQIDTVGGGQARGRDGDGALALPRGRRLLASNYKARRFGILRWVWRSGS